MVRGADRDMPSFQRMRDAQPGFLAKTHPVGDAAQAIVDGVLGRKRGVFAPGWLRYLSGLRMLLRTRLGERDGLKLAPQLDRDTLERVQQRGALAGSMRDTAAMQAAAASAGRTFEQPE